MDFVPIALLALAACVYFWLRILKTSLSKGLLWLGLYLILLVVRSLLPPAIRRNISFGYLFLALTIIMPAAIYCFMNARVGLSWLAGALLVFLPAVGFRWLDKQYELLPMGTHFLWHLFGGVSVFLLMQYIYLTDLKRMEHGGESST